MQGASPTWADWLLAVFLGGPLLLFVLFFVTLPSTSYLLVKRQRVNDIRNWARAQGLQLVSAEPVGTASHMVIHYGRIRPPPPGPPMFDIVLRGPEGDRTATAIFKRNSTFPPERLEVSWEPRQMYESEAHPPGRTN